MTKQPAAEMKPAIMAEAPKTHFQLAYSAIRPDTMLPKTLPSGAPAAKETLLVKLAQMLSQQVRTKGAENKRLP